MDVRMYYIFRLKASSFKSSGSLPSHRTVGRKLTEWVLFREYWDSSSDLGTIASRTGITREEVASYVQGCLGERFLTIRKRLRVEDAKHLLLSRPDMTFAEIARTTGFPDKSDFKRAFREETGYSARIWRESRGCRIGCRVRAIRESNRNHYHALRKSA